ncbi:hypothetical protein GCM10018953_08710 [Streptosporangium nondiastaticum]|uniref:hypothetical protein n=1 Tax=Streptosporangium nondiastaticum TaxID=35764 RepID=UPI0031F74179
MRGQSRRPPANPPPTTVYAFRDRIDSRDEGLPFLAFIRIEWFRDQDGVEKSCSPRTLAHTIRKIIEPLAQKGSVLRARAVEDEIFVELSQRLPLRVSSLVVSNVTVTLTVDDEVIDAAHKEEHLRREIKLDELARRQAKGRYDFLRDVILADPGAAQLYSLVDLPERIGKLPSRDHDELVRRIAEWHPKSRWVVVGQILNDFLNKLSESGKNDLITVLHGAISTLGTEAQIARIEKEFAISETPNHKDIFNSSDINPQVQ